MDQNSGTSFGGPDQAPPPPGEPGLTPQEARRKTTRNLIVLGLWVLLGIVVGGIYLGWEATHSKSTQTTITISPPAIPGVGTQKGETEVCTQIPLVLSTGELIKANATSDLAMGKKDLPSVDQFKLSQLIASLQTLAAQAPPSLAPGIDEYTAYYVQLQKLKYGTTLGEPSSTDATFASAAIRRTCHS